MAIEAKTVVRVETGQSVDNLKALREQAKQYRQDMEGAEIGSEKFTEAQRKLSEVSDQVKNVLMLGTKEIDDTNKSYDSLVRTMSQLTKEWRATGDEAERARLGEQILEINTQLKNLDASRGNFQRNVGNYSSAFDGLSTSMSQVVRELPSLQMGLNTFVLAISNNLPILADNIARVKAEVADLNAKGDKSVSTIGAIVKSFMSWNTVLTLGIVAVQAIVSNWDKISKLWRDTTPQEKAEEAIEAMNKAIERQQNLLREQNTEALRQYTAELRNVGGDADKAREALERYNQALKDNALAQAEANKATASNRYNELKKQEADITERIKDLEETLRKYGGGRDSASYANEINESKQTLKEIQGLIAEAKAGLDKYTESAVKAENDIVKAQVDADIKRVEDAKKRREEEAQAYVDLWVKTFEQVEEDIAKTMEEDNFRKSLHDATNERIDAVIAEEIAEFDALVKIEEEVTKHEKAEAEKRKKIAEDEAKAKIAQAKAERDQRISILSDLTGNMASIFEENTIAYKSFAIAEAVINTYQAATKSIAELGMPWGAAAAASALAAGFAQVKNIMSVDTSGKTTPDINGDVGAVVSAPAVVQEVPITRTITDTSVEDRLNAKLADQRVILVYSDVEEFGKQVQVQRSESSF